MKFGLIICIVVVSTACAAAPNTTLSSKEAIAIANATASSTHKDLSVYEKPKSSREDNGNWFILYEHKPSFGTDQYGKRVPFVAFDDCFWVTVDVNTGSAKLDPCG